MESDKAMFESFNISTKEGICVNDLAYKIKTKMCQIQMKMFHPQDFKIVYDPGFEHDVQCRIPDTTKAKEVLGFEAKYSLDASLDLLIPWYMDAIDKGMI